MRSLLLLTLLLNGCTTYVGIAMNDQEGSAPEIHLDNPVGIVGGSMEVGDFELFIEHHSGIFYREQGYGYNLTGVKYYLTAD